MTGLLRRVGAGAPLFLVLMLGAAATLLPLTAIAPAATPAVSPERGFELLTTKPYLTPDFDDEVFERLHTCWEPEARDAAAQASPAERRKLTLARYGLTEHPDGPRATALQYTPADGGGWAMNCMACHTGKVAGQVIYGAPNTHYLLQTLTEDVRAVKFALGKKFTHMDKGSLVYPLGGSVGTTNAVMFGHILLAFRDPDLTFHADRPLPPLTHHDEDAIPFWHYKHKTRLYVDNFAPRNHRALMQFLLIPRNGPDKFNAWEDDFRNIEAWLLSLPSPKYPYAIDRKLAAHGYTLFERRCAECHGNYRAPRADGGEVAAADDERSDARGRALGYSSLLYYPERVIKLEEIGTDPVRLQAMRAEGRARYGETWFTFFGAEKVVADPGGYLAPPLDGVWASAPYFHNGSVPTLAEVLTSGDRPKLWRRSVDGYDQTRVGLEVERLAEIPPDDRSDARRKRLYFDGSLPGKSPAGHTFPDQLNAEEKRAVLEYLKTL